MKVVEMRTLSTLMQNDKNTVLDVKLGHPNEFMLAAWKLHFF